MRRISVPLSARRRNRGERVLPIFLSLPRRSASLPFPTAHRNLRQVLDCGSPLPLWTQPFVRRSRRSNEADLPSPSPARRSRGERGTGRGMIPNLPFAVQRSAAAPVFPTAHRNLRQVLDSGFAHRVESLPLWSQPLLRRSRRSNEADSRPLRATQRSWGENCMGEVLPIFHSRFNIWLQFRIELVLVFFPTGNQKFGTRNFSRTGIQRALATTCGPPDFVIRISGIHSSFGFRNSSFPTFCGVF